MKKITPVMILHLILLMAMILCSVFAAINFIVGFGNAAGMEKYENLTNVFLMLLILAMLIMGAVHLLDAYSKQAAGFYKAFLLLHVAVCAVTIFIDLYFHVGSTFLTAVSILYAAKIVALLILALGKDLGSKNSWVLFGVLLALDAAAFVLALIEMTGSGFNFTFMGYVTALIADGTTGLAIRGKYKDKQARGSK